MKASILSLSSISLLKRYINNNVNRLFMCPNSVLYLSKHGYLITGFICLLMHYKMEESNLWKDIEKICKGYTVLLVVRLHFRLN